MSALAASCCRSFGEGGSRDGAQEVLAVVFVLVFITRQLMVSWLWPMLHQVNLRRLLFGIWSGLIVELSITFGTKTAGEVFVEL